MANIAQPERADEIIRLMREQGPLVMLWIDVTNQAEVQGIALYLVGGFVRDLLLHARHATPDLDFVVEASAINFAESMQAKYGGALNRNPPFGTATWNVDEVAFVSASAPLGHIDFVTARRESYPQPGALPVVEPSTIEDDLRRRDFTINAMAIRLTPGPFGTLIDPFGGEKDLHDGLIRVLHDGSFVDDATRIFRAVRFEQRFDFHVEPHTLGLIPQGLATISAISGERLNHELDLIWRESMPEHATQRLHELGVLEAIFTGLSFDESTSAAFKAARWLLETAAWKKFAVSQQDVYRVLLACRSENPQALGQRLLLERNKIQQFVEGRALYKLLGELGEPLRPSQIAQHLQPFGDVALAAGWAIAPTFTARQQIEHWAQELRYIEPILTGDDLLAMGLSQGPRLGKLLRELWRARYDGEVSTVDDERAYIEKLVAEGFGL